MTQEEKAKRYDDALTKARNIVNSINVGLIGKDSFEAVFPELKESEDERIRKALRERIINYDPNNEILIKEEGISQKQFLAWIEKQGQVRCTGVGKKEATGVLKEMLDDEEMKEQKQEWSEEDNELLDEVDYILTCIRNMVYNKELESENISKLPKDYDILIDRLKSLKDRHTWKPSEEQMEAFHTVVYLKDLDCYGGLRDNLLSLYNDLKKLKGE